MDEQYPMALPEGSVLSGQYVIERVLGQGGFGITYCARDHKTGDYVAIKEFFPGSMASRANTTVLKAEDFRPMRKQRKDLLPPWRHKINNNTLSVFLKK